MRNNNTRDSKSVKLLIIANNDSKIDNERIEG